MARKEYSPDDRILDLDNPQDKQASVGRADIWMTPELKQAAKALQNSWDLSHDDQMASLNIRDVNLKFVSHEQRTAFLKALEDLAKLVNPNFPRTYPLSQPTAPESPSTVDVAWTNFWYKYFLPEVFDTVMQDTAATELNTIPAQPEILNQAKACLAAYGIGFVRMDLVVDECVDRGAADSLTESLREAHSRLLKFLQLFVQSMSEPGVHRVIILGEDQFEVDGTLQEFTGAALRALLALALLRDKADFKLEDFAKLYHGGGVDIARTDFDNAMKALKKELPHTKAHIPSQNHRNTTGIKFQVRVGDAVIGRRLAGFYKQKSTS